MKKATIVSGIFISLLLVGCQNDTTTSERHEEEESTQIEKSEMPSYDEAESTTALEEGKSEPEISSEEEIEIAYKVNKDNWKIEPLGDEEAKVVLLTIDDAPDQHAVEMAETLHQLEVGAIFFVNGHFLKEEEGQERLKAIHDLGFTIGNHTMTHANLSEIPGEDQRHEILDVNHLVEEIIGERPQFFRAPFGVNTETSRQLIVEEEMTPMNWTYGYDWEKEYQTAETLTEIMVNTPYLNDGANILMHDREWTAEALEQIVKGLQEKGYQFVAPEQIQKDSGMS